MKIKTPILIAIIVLIALVILAIIFGGYKKPGTTPGPEEISIAKEIYGISGTIEEIQQNTLTVNALILLQDPSKEPLNKLVKVLVSDETKIYKLEFPRPESMSQEELKRGVVPRETEIELPGLKRGDKVDIRTNKNISENIKNNTPFTASAINVINK